MDRSILIRNPEKIQDGIVDIYGNLISSEQRKEIISNVNLLPITQRLDDICNAIKNNTLVIIDAKTGSGKTTQVGKEAMFLNLGKRGLNHVHMTQPRIMAALSNSERVSREILSQTGNLDYSLGKRIGYNTGKHKNYSKETKLLFTTDAQEVTRQLMSDIVPEILIIDEVHNYTIPTEILLSIVREYLSKGGKKDLKVIIMSATIDKEKMIDYFKDVSSDIPYFDVPGRVQKIEEYHKKSNDLLETIYNTYSEGKPSIVFVEGKKAIYNTIDNLEKLIIEKEGEINSKDEKQNKIKNEIDTFSKTIDEKIISKLKDFCDEFNKLISSNLSHIIDRKDIIELNKQLKTIFDIEKINYYLGLLINSINNNDNKNVVENIGSAFKSSIGNNNIKLELNNFLKEITDLIQHYKSEQQQIIDEDFLQEESNEILVNISKKNIEKLESIDIKSFSNFIKEFESFPDFVDKFKFLLDELYKEIFKVKNIYGIIPLHSDLSIEDQKKAFDETTRVIVSTNAAEMSLTIPDVEAVIDNGLQKVVVLNEWGVDEIQTIHTSQANSLQRKGRTGRTKPGEWHYVNDKKFEDLDKFPKTEIEMASLDRYYLLCLKNNKKIEEMEFLHQAQEHAIEIAIDKLIKLKAITKEKEVTEIGNFILSLPVEPDIGRIIYEGIIEEGKKKLIHNDLLLLTSILESKDFLETKNDKWKNLSILIKTEGKFNDLEFHLGLFKLFTSKEISNLELNLLANLGVSKELLEIFRDNNKGKKMLFEMVDLSIIGVKEKYLDEILVKFIEIKESLETFNIKIKNLDDEIDENYIKRCILSGNPNNIFRYDGKKKAFVNDIKGKFMKSALSVTGEKSSKLFIGNPFVINEGKIMRFLSRLLPIDESDIKEVFGKDIEISSDRKLNLVKKKKTNEICLVGSKDCSFGGIRLNDLSYIIGQDNFENNFKNLYLPDFLITNNQSVKNFIRELSKDIPEDQKFDYNKFKKILGSYTDGLYRYFMDSKKNLNKIERKFMDDEDIVLKIKSSEDPIVVDFLINPFISK